MHPVAGRDAEAVTLEFLSQLPDVRCQIQTNVEAASRAIPPQARA